jgi:peptide deformylase
MVKLKNKQIEILQKENPILRQVSCVVPEAEIKSEEIKKIIADLKIAMNSQSDAIAISAIQIGKPVRLFLISNKIYEILGEDPEVAKKKKDLIFINPKIKKTSKEKQNLEEGCLSVRYFYGKVERPTKATIEWYDENGIKASRGVSGLIAQIVQHENDHLDGILFIDKATELVEITPEEFEKNLKGGV